MILFISIILNIFFIITLMILTEFKFLSRKHRFCVKNNGWIMHFSQNGLDWKKDTLFEFKKGYFSTYNKEYNYCFEYQLHIKKIPYGWNNPLLTEE